jgi:hypothetical protein
MTKTEGVTSEEVQPKPKKRGRKAKGEENTSGVFVMQCDPEEDADIHISYMNTVPKSYVLKQAVRLWMQEEQKRKNPMQVQGNSLEVTALLQQILQGQQVPNASPVQSEVPQPVVKQAQVEEEKENNEMPKMNSAAKSILSKNRKKKKKKKEIGKSYLFFLSFLDICVNMCSLHQFVTLGFGLHILRYEP